ncbi:MAG: DNA polymerase IV [Candidatus Bathyarchaeia archaeon]
MKPLTSRENEGRKRIIFHVDMDQFYAAVEEREHPELRGKPVVVGADPKGGSGRGVVSTSNYEARKYGVRSGMPISRAWKLCPEAVYVQPNYQLYIEASSRIMGILRKYADKFERWGLDEAFLDVGSKVSSFEEARWLAETVKREVYEKERLTCSIGVGPNKLIAKIASDFKKPNGLTVVKEGEAEGFLAPLPVRKLLWVGKKTERKLNEMGIKTIGDLAKYDVSVLTEKFGVMGTQYYLSAYGMDNSEVSERGEIKSIGRETTFEEDTADSSIVFEAMDRLGGEIIEELVEGKLLFKTVTVKIRYENFETHTHGKTLHFYTGSLQSLEKTARELIQPYFSRNRKVRLVGVRVSNFASGRKQKTLG